MLRRRTTAFTLTTGVVCLMLLAGSGLASAQGGTPMASPAASAVASPVASPAANTGTITGRVTDHATGKPLADVYITVGWRDLMLATMTDADGRYTVPNVPAGKSAPVLGFHDDGYRYHNSQYDDKIDIVLKPGETYHFDFSLIRLNDPAGEPQLSDATISSTQVAPGQQVTFEVTAKGGKGNLSSEVIAANPQLGWMVLMKSVGGDRFRATVTIPSASAPGDYAFAFFAASNACYVNSVFPKVTVHITQS
ncbi:MAG: carboxypeptidase-like regulatory domain-containing protein [Thermomicrobiales bacterium]